MINITLLTTEGCNTCKTVKETLNKLQSAYDLNIKDIDVTTDEGKQLAERHNITSAPGIIINGEFFASGLVTEDKLKEKFDSLI